MKAAEIDRLKAELEKRNAEIEALDVFKLEAQARIAELEAELEQRTVGRWICPSCNQQYTQGMRCPGCGTGVNSARTAYERIAELEAEVDAGKRMVYRYNKELNEKSAALFRCQGMLCRMQLMYVPTGTIVDGELATLIHDLDLLLSGKAMVRRDEIFIKHIQQHLEPGQQVVCKICGESADEIIAEEL